MVASTSPPGDTPREGEEPDGSKEEEEEKSKSRFFDAKESPEEP